MSNRFSHVLRSYSDGILIGKNTALTDAPSLNTRLVPGKSPVKILIDKYLDVPTENNFYTSGGNIIVFNLIMNQTKDGVEYILLKDDDRLLKQILDELFKRDIGILLVEGGSITIQNFIDLELYDEVYEIRTSKILETGVKKPSRINNLKKIYSFRDDIVLKKFVNRLSDC
jgi:diaminohydroxyphosphoribosylaminopyrimidine deaminase/5-amino-6-(5-phosphoribosylamino)uracil reductase